jgi:hypothetical protein
MLRRIDEGDAARELARARVADPGEPVVAPVTDAEHDPGTLLPRDHPMWVRDTFTVSQRARELIARLKPVAIAVLTFWDHRARAAVVAGCRLFIDASGSYRLP